MGEADTMLSLIVVQVVQNAESYHDVCLSESRVIPKGLCVANYESSLGTVCLLGRSNLGGIDVEAEILDLREPRQYLCRYQFRHG